MRVSYDTFAVENFTSVTWQVWAIPNGIEIVWCGCFPPTTSRVEKFEGSRYFLGPWYVFVMSNSEEQDCNSYDDEQDMMNLPSHLRVEK